MWNYIKKLANILVILAILFWPVSPIIGYSWTLGSTANGTSTTTNSSDALRVSSATTTYGGRVISGEVRAWVDSGSSRTRMVIYSDVAGAPTTLLAVSDEVTITQTSEAGVSYVFSGENQIILSPNTAYWIGFHNEDPGAVNLNYSNGATANLRKTMTDTYSDGSPTSFTGSPTSGNGPIDAYVTLEEQNVGASYPLLNPNLYDSGLRLDLDGVDERLASASNPSYSSDTKSGGRSLCLWFNLDTTPASETNMTLFAWSNSDAQGVWNMRIRNGRASVPWTGVRWELQTALDTGSGTGTSTFIYSSAQTFSASTLYHLCLVSSGTAWTLYVNASSTTLTVSAAGSGGNDGDWWGDVNGSGTITFTSGSSAAGASFLDGKIDEIAYFLDDLTASEVSLLYNGGKPIHPRAVGLTDLDHYWKLGEAENGSVSTIYDMRGSDNWSGTNMEAADIVPTNYY